jgi:hypothetical protein
MPRAEGGLLSTLIQEAWKAYQDSIASEAEQARVAERIAQHFESRIPESDFAVLKRWGCIATNDTCNVAVYDATQPERPYSERFGIKLPRSIPVVGLCGRGYPSLSACVPYDRDDLAPAELNDYFAGLLAARKAYLAEYKASSAFPYEFKKKNGTWPVWGEIEDAFSVLGRYLKGRRGLANP